MSHVPPGVRCSLTCVLLVAVAGCGEQQAGAGSGRAGEPITTGLVADLQKSGFQVNPGYATLYTEQDCKDATYPKLKNCLLNNPAAPYVSPVVKTWPDEYVDPATVNAFGRTRSGYSATYRLDPRDAIVLYGKMPPPGRYMSLQSWEFSRRGQWKTSDAPDGRRSAGQIGHRRQPGTPQKKGDVNCHL
ncbi:hypothetical protein [Streptomyces sp. NK08204]|uniref:hypothetical protein n=1 Tax=Streptomyces sp. NK08204 TaxID=2873260 RepID=UPI001CEDA78B|nr:hypothetical protein [Streptomyces sp. NK08204]